MIGNAKEYVIKQFEELAKQKGANAIIGIDIETSFGETLARVAINGTAVVVSSAETSIRINDEKDSSSVITVSKSNSPEGFLPIEINVSNQHGINEIALCLQALDDAIPSNIMADIEKKHDLYLRQKELLATLLDHGAISQAQHDKSLRDLTEKMGIQPSDQPNGKVCGKAVKIVSHSDYKTSADIYTHLNQEMMRATAEGMVDVFNKVDAEAKKSRWQRPQAGSMILFSKTGS